MAIEELRNYAYKIGDALYDCHTRLRHLYPEYGNIDAVFIAELTVNGKTERMSLSSIDSTQGQRNKDLLDAQHAIDLCKDFIATNEEATIG